MFFSLCPLCLCEKIFYTSHTPTGKAERKTEMKKTILTIALVLALAILAACTRETAPAGTPETTEPFEGTIMSIGPAITEILIDLGLGSRIIAADDFSSFVPGVPSDLVFVLDMWTPDIEALVAVAPDILIITEMLNLESDTLDLLASLGTRVISIPQFNRVADIVDNIHFIAGEMGVLAAGEVLTQTMLSEIEAARAIAETITERRTVYFELNPLPMLFTFGADTFLHEIMEIVGAENIFDDAGDWVSISDEQVLARNPDVIITNVGWMDNAIEELKSRPGWDSLDAVANNRVYLVCENTTSRDNHRIVQAMREIARAVYPEYF